MAEASLVAILAVCSYTDWKERKIYNWATLGGTCLALIYNLYYFGAQGIKVSLIGWMVGTGILIIPYLFGGIGAGDVKLLGTVGAYLGAGAVFQSFLVAALLGGIYATTILTRQRKFFSTIKKIAVGLTLVFSGAYQFGSLSIQENTAAVTIPYGVVIAAGTLLVIILGG